MRSFFDKRVPGEKTAILKPSHDEHKPWVEKYRPKKVDDLVFQEEVVSLLKKVVNGADLPHLLFYGPPGTGKTSAAVALCNQLYKTKEAYNDRVLEMNASDERGINIVRQRIKQFAQQAVSAKVAGKPCAAYKIVILDEADAMTTAAQAALRRTMESESSTTRFFLICNYISRIIDPLTSRCAKFRFKALPVDNQIERLSFICEEENVVASREALTQLVQLTEGDLRKSINYLQSMSQRGELRPEVILDMANYVPDEVVYGFVTACRSMSSRVVQSNVDNFMLNGYSVYQLIRQLYKIVCDKTETHLENLSGIAVKGGVDGEKFAVYFALKICSSDILHHVKTQ
ncbi:hypothetical protein QR680_017338 [Steinernema hermaphroditum]|uniref:AAA+ ATPase domain-containing protein n=1 Tax=Steinernema hermaphroditum TaxID=289476 RepID=A0AA39HFD1_9BILA|nr:hypothetical protein QR680_017338 [Steinernema hermaphroditum]